MKGEINYGYCHCGCGEKAGLRRVHKYKNGIRVLFKGEPRKFITGHHTRKSPEEYVVDENGCWVWQRAIRDTGYGSISINGKQMLAHRYMYEKLRGPIPDGMYLDHLCKNRACVNPEHLEVVTFKENIRRGKRVKLTEQDIPEIKKLSASGVRQKEIAIKYGVSSCHVSRIINGEKWR